MDSVAQDRVVRCERCDEDGPISTMRLNGMQSNGTLRYRHRNGHGCQVAAQPRDSVVPSRTGLVPFHGSEVRGAVVEGAGWIRVSDVCERLGVDASTQTEYLKNNPSFTAYAVKLTTGKGRPSWHIRGDKVPGWVRTINANKVKPETRAALLWIQEQFDAVLHAWVTGAEIPASPARVDVMPVNTTDIGTALAQGVNALVDMMTQAITQRVVSEVRGLLGDAPQQVAETHSAVKDATHIVRETVIVEDGWASDGFMYVAVNEHDGLMSLGETIKDPPELRLEDGDYNKHKASTKPDDCHWYMAVTVRTDKRKRAQEWIQQMARRYGCRHISGDRFVLDPSFVREARRLSGPMRLETMRRQVVDEDLFQPPLFRSAA